MPQQLILPPKRQGGTILFVVLITMLVLMISSVGMIRSFDTSIGLASNLAFKRDLSNQAERGIASALALINAGTLGDSNINTSNYSASMLASDAQGIPLAIMSNTTFTSTGFSGTDITDASSGVVIRTVIDRQCRVTGSPNMLTDCAFINVGTETDPNYQVVYRITSRATGPKNTQVFLQSIASR